ncbi:hypothetical protein [Puia sp.]|jgi:hypothetical protein|uniref:hypothetical protein n=1 Tax=Puia sp. TaxID=2045100 RepID=UPI002F41FA93
MEKDGRYKKIKPLFRDKVVRKFSEIFSEEVIPKTVLADDLKKNNNQIGKLIKSPGGFKVRDLFRIIERSELSIEQLVQLFESDYQDDYKVDNPGKNKGYKHIKTMFNDGAINIFSDIFDHVPETTVAEDIGKRKAKIDLAKLTYTQVDRIAKLCELTKADIFQLIAAQLNNK